MLTEQLAARYNTVSVPEYAREYIDRIGRPYIKDDILDIAKGQIDLEKALENKAGGYLFCDTELIVTKIWSDVKYGNCDPWILEMIDRNRYDLYLLCDIDIPWEFDPQREHPHYRKELFELYYNELAHRNFPFSVVSGLGPDRLENAVRIIEDLFNR